MKIEHVALYVNDLEKCKDFFFNISTGNQITATIIKQQISVPNIGS